MLCVPAVGRSMRALQKVGEEKRRKLPAHKGGARVKDEGGALTGYHHLTLDFKLDSIQHATPDRAHL